MTVLFLGITLMVMGFSAAAIFLSEYQLKAGKISLSAGIAGTVMLLIAMFIPPKETIYTMAAAYGVQVAAENPDVKRVAGKSLALLESAIDSYTKKAKAE